MKFYTSYIFFKKCLIRLSKIKYTSFIYWRCLLHYCRIRKIPWKCSLYTNMFFKAYTFWVCFNKPKPITLVWNTFANGVLRIDFLSRFLQGRITQTERSFHANLKAWVHNEYLSNSEIIGKKWNSSSMFFWCQQSV